MAVKRVLSRLLRLRELEEDLKRSELAGALSLYAQASNDLQALRSRSIDSRVELVQGIERSNELQRVDALMAVAHAEFEIQSLASMLSKIQIEVERIQKQFMEQRTARRQVETLVAEAKQADQSDTARRAQQMIDDWYGRRTRTQQLILKKRARE